MISVDSICTAVCHEHVLSRWIENGFMWVALGLTVVQSGAGMGKVIFEQVGRWLDETCF